MRGRGPPGFSLVPPPLGLEVENQDGMKAAARKIVEMGARAVVVTGGHLEKAVDVYSMARSSKLSLATA